MVLKIKQFGCHRTCTCIVNVWLTRALGIPILTNSFGWKHGFAVPEVFPGGRFGNFGFLISIKDPYAWVQSYARWKEVPLSPDFARDAVAGWNAKYLNWLTVLPLRVVIPIEQLLADPEAILANVCRTFGVQIRRETGAQDLPHQIIAPGEITTRDRFNGERYLSRSYMSEIPAEVVAVVSENIEWDLIKEFGYKKE